MPSALQVTSPSVSGDEVLDNIPPLLTGGGLTAVLTWLIYMFGTGRIVTRREHENRMADKNSQLADKDKALQVKDAQLEKLSVVGEAVVKILASVEDLAKRRAK